MTLLGVGVVGLHGTEVTQERVEAPVERIVRLREHSQVPLAGLIRRVLIKPRACMRMAKGERGVRHMPFTGCFKMKCQHFSV